MRAPTFARSGNSLSPRSKATHLSTAGYVFFLSVLENRMRTIPGQSAAAFFISSMHWKIQVTHRRKIAPVRELLACILYFLRLPLDRIHRANPQAGERYRSFSSDGSTAFQVVYRSCLGAQGSEQSRGWVFRRENRGAPAAYRLPASH